MQSKTELSNLPNDFAKFPQEILLIIALFLDKNSLLTFPFVCKSFNFLFNKQSYFWQIKYNQINTRRQDVLTMFDPPEDYRSATIRQLFLKEKLKRTFIVRSSNDNAMKSSNTNKDKSPGLFRKIFNKKKKNNAASSSIEEFLLEIEGFAAKPFNFSQAYRFIKTDNFNEFITQMTYFSHALPFILARNFPSPNFEQALTDDENDLKRIFPSEILNGKAFDFVFKLFPIALENNLPNFFHGLLGFLLMYLMFARQTYLTHYKNELVYPVQQKFEVAIASIFDSKKRHFIEAFLQSINVVPFLYELALYSNIVHHIIEYKIDPHILLGDKKTRDNLCRYLSERLLESSPENKLIILYLRLLNNHSKEEQINIIKSLRVHEDFLPMFEDILACKEFVDLKIIYTGIKNFNASKKALTDAEAALAGDLELMSRGIASMDNQSLEGLPHRIAIATSKILSLRNVHKKYKEELEIIVSSKKTSEVSLKIEHEARSS